MGLNFLSVCFLARERSACLFRRAFRSDKKQRPQLQAIHDRRSGMLIVRIITAAITIPPSAASTLFRGAGAVLRAITCDACAPRVTIVRRISMSSSAGVMSRQPGIRNTLQAGAVRPHP
jgi:hypothetical protein